MSKPDRTVQPAEDPQRHIMNTMVEYRGEISNQTGDDHMSMATTCFCIALMYAFNADVIINLIKSVSLKSGDN